MTLLVAEESYDCCYPAVSHPAQRISIKLGETKVQVTPQKEPHFFQFLWTSFFKQFWNPEIPYCNPNSQVINYAAVRPAHGLVLSDISLKVFDQSLYKIKKTLRIFVG